MRRIVTGDLLDLKELLADKFFVVLVSAETTIPSNDAIYVLKDLFPSNDAINAYLRDGQEEFDRVYHAEIELDRIKQVQYGAVLYGILKCNKKVALIKYHDEIKASLVHQEEITNIPFLESLCRLFRKKFGLEYMNYNTYIKRFKRTGKDFYEGEVRGMDDFDRFCKSLSDLVDFSTIEMDVEEAPTQTDKKEYKVKQQDNRTQRDKEFDEHNSVMKEYMNMKPNELPKLVILNFDKYQLQAYIDRHNLNDTISRHFRTNDLEIISREELAQFIKYMV